MRRHALIVLAILTASLGLVAAPGTASLAAVAGGAIDTATVNSVSCAAAGSCVTERHGWWGKAMEVRGLAALNKGQFSEFPSVSCRSVGNCAIAGTYQLASSSSQAFVVSQRDGHWGLALEVPGLAALDTAKLSETNAVSCASAGNCVAGGQYTPRPAECPFSACPAFVASQKRGVWGKAQPVRFR